jgi:Na+-transporting NADH:ubiquinone oxidoreductase subunit B
MFWGAIPGSIGESSKAIIILGAIFLVVTKVADWRIMFSMLLGAISMTLVLNMWGAEPFYEISWTNQLLMGSFLFAMAFMATDPVTASSTSKGKWLYGFGIGVIGMFIRVNNSAYPEGWMLAILFMNTFAPLIDHYVIQGNMTKRLKRA